MLREPNKKLLEINFLDYKNNNLENLLINKITKDEFLNSKFLKKSELSNTILFTDIETMPMGVQKLLSLELKNHKNNLALISRNTKIIATTFKKYKTNLK